MKVCQNAHLLFLNTKPQLSQAGALLLPKDFVSLFLKELTRILQRMIRCAWLTLWLIAWILKVSGSCIRNAAAALTIPGWCSRSFYMPIWTTSIPAGKLKSSFTVTSIISGLPDMRNRISLPSTVSATGWRRKIIDWFPAGRSDGLLVVNTWVLRY